MANTKEYKIVINGVQESIDAVKSLNEQLKSLEDRIKALESKSIGVKATSSTGGGSKSSSTGSLSEEEKLQKQINQLEEKRVAYSKEIYQNYLAAKDVLSETVKDQKSIAATERLQANAYSNTIQGMKQELADIKSAIQTVDLGDTDQLDKMVKRANELNEALKKIEQSYDQFGRNVGNYKSAFDGLDKVRISVGGTVREFGSAREAIKVLNNELKTMAINGQQDTEAFKELRQAVMQLESAANDAKKPMDDIMDIMEGLTAVASVTNGLSAFFGVDDSEIQRSIQKLVALQNVLKGIQVISKQMETGEGIGGFLSLGNALTDRLVARITGARLGMNGLAASTRGATLAVKGLSVALKGIGIGVVLVLLEKAIPVIESWAEEITKSADKVKMLDEYEKALNKTFETRKDLLSSSYLKGEISDEEFLSNQYSLQNNYLSAQINLLKERLELLRNKGQDFGVYLGLYGSDSETDYSGGKLTGSTNVRSYNPLFSLEETMPTLKISIETVEELDEAIRKCQEALKENKDYFSKWGEGISDWFSSLFTTVDDTEDALARLGQIRIGDLVARFEELNKKFKDQEISAQEYGKELAKLKAEMNDNEILQSVLANLDRYIPDEAAVRAINNIINAIFNLEDSFNMSSPEQIRHWAQVRIDAMAEGIGKSKAQIDADEKYEIAQYGKTQEQIDLIRAKYNRKRLEAQERYNKEMKSKAEQGARELENVIRETNALRIELMSDGFEKELAKLEEEKRQRVKKAQELGISVAAVIELYQKKIDDLRKDWAYRTEQTYLDMWNRIYRINHNNARLNFESQLRELEYEYQQLRDKLAEKYSDSNLEYSEQNISISKRPKRGKDVDSENASDFKYKVLIEKDEEYTKRLREEYKTRTEDRKKYYAETASLDIEEENKRYANSQASLKENMNNELRTLQNGYKREDHELEEHYKKGLISSEKYNEGVERLNKEREEQEALIQQNYYTKSEEEERKHNEKIGQIKQTSEESILNNYRSFIEKLSNIDASNPVINGAGFINIGATRRRNKQLIDAYRELQTEISGEITRLKSKLDSTDITKKEREEIQRLIAIYEELMTRLGMASLQVQNSTKEAIEKSTAQILSYVQAAIQSFNDIMQAVWDAEDIAFEKQQDELDKWNEELDKKLDEQQEIVEKHKDAIDSIEDELATARGSRRQHLIDQINAEMEAQREARRQEQKIQKEKEKAEKKQEELDKKRKKAEYERNMLQAIVNGAMAVTFAAMNNWPVPAIPMMALAAATTAAQVAIMAANKPYAKGGMLEGPSHKQGGIPVGNTGIEVEGKEYVIRKKSTTPNVELLDMINRSERKLTLDDFINFYSSGKLKKNISSMSPKTVFADGGTIPTLSNDIDINDRLLSAMEAYAERPVVVSVVDINNRQNAVKNVQVLAGLE